LRRCLHWLLKPLLMNCLKRLRPQSCHPWGRFWEVSN